MDFLQVINHFYPEDNELKHLLLTHSEAVANKALAIASLHPELHIDLTFLREAAMLHDHWHHRCLMRLASFVSERNLIFVMEGLAQRCCENSDILSTLAFANDIRVRD